MQARRGRSRREGTGSGRDPETGIAVEASADMIGGGDRRAAAVVSEGIGGGERPFPLSNRMGVGS